VGATGTAGLDNQYTTITPKALIGKGFGDLQTELLRPIAITGEIQYIVPTVPNVYANGILSQQTPTTVVYGATLQYSLQYMNAYVHEIDGPEILRHLVVDLEANFSTLYRTSAPRSSIPYLERMKPPASSDRGSTT